MRTALVASRVFEPEGTAAAYRLGNLVRGLQRAGYTVTVLTSKAPNGPASTRAVRRWPVLRDRSGSVRGYVQYLSFDIPLFLRLLFAPRTEVVVVEPPPTTGLVTRVACWIRRTPYVYFAADVLSTAVEGIGSGRGVVAVVRWLERRALRGAAGVLAVSAPVRREVIELGTDSRMVVDIGTGIDTDQFSPSGPVVTDVAPYFVYAGTMSEVHGAGVFIDAFSKVAAQNPEVQLRIFGAGVDRDDLVSRSKDLGDRVIFSGTVEAEELAPWIRGATASLASVRPGKGYDFAFATKALASLGCGVPVVYAGVGPLSTLIPENELGWAAGWDADDVAAAMLQALDTSREVPDRRLSDWVEQNHSLRAVADRAAEAIVGWTGPEGSR